MGTNNDESGPAVSAGHPGCDGCSHRNHSDGDNWCYMFKDAPSSLPCGQHDKFEAEREAMGKAIRRNPALLAMMVLAEMAKQEFELPGRTPRGF